MSFKPADIVRAKGDKERVSMVVNEVKGQRVQCTWLDRERHTGWFDEDQLELAPADEEIEEE